jgi:hypothetical protein
MCQRHQYHFQLTELLKQVFVGHLSDPVAPAALVLSKLVLSRLPDLVLLSYLPGQLHLLLQYHL